MTEHTESPRLVPARLVAAHRIDPLVPGGHLIDADQVRAHGRGTLLDLVDNPLQRSNRAMRFDEPELARTVRHSERAHTNLLYSLGDAAGGRRDHTRADGHAT